MPNKVFKPEKYGKTFGERKNWLRNEEDAKIYNQTRWRKFRLSYIKRNPFCVVCKRGGYFVDHIKPISEGGGIYDESNLQTLCVSCNAKKTSEQARNLTKKNTSKK